MAYDDRPRCAETGKVIFAEQQDALDELAHVTRQAILGKWRPRTETGVYACASCVGWHLTSRPRSGQIVSDR